MPTETAATDPLSVRERPKRSSARHAATYAPEMAAQRVPPSACRTSQSTQSVRSPSASKSVTERIDRPLDLHRATALLPARGLPLGAIARGSGQQRVLGRKPAAPLAVEPAWDAFLDRGCAEHLRLSLAEEDGAVRLLEVVGQQLQRAQFVRTATVVSHALTRALTRPPHRARRARRAPPAQSEAVGSGRPSRGTRPGR